MGEAVGNRNGSNASSSDLTVESLAKIAYHHNLEGIHDFKRVTDAIASILFVGQEQAINQHRIDFTDMVWLPVHWALNEKSWFLTYKCILAGVPLLLVNPAYTANFAISVVKSLRSNSKLSIINCKQATADSAI